MDSLGIFDDLKSAALAVDNLIAAGFAEGQVTSLSSVPYPHGVLVETDQRTWLRWFVLGMALIGAIAGFALAAGTAWVYPVRTGDKPIVALFPTGIITYEFTMLFAMLGAIVGMFLEMRLPPRQKRLYDEAISEGMIGIAVVTTSEEDARKAAGILRQAGARRIAGEERV